MAQIRGSGFASVTSNHELVGRVLLFRTKPGRYVLRKFSVCDHSEQKQFSGQDQKGVVLWSEILGLWPLKTKTGRFVVRIFFGLGRGRLFLELAPQNVLRYRTTPGRLLVQIV